MVSVTHSQQSITKGVGKTIFRLYYYLCTNVGPLESWDDQDPNAPPYASLYYKGKQDTALRETHPNDESSIRRAMLHEWAYRCLLHLTVIIITLLPAQPSE